MNNISDIIYKEFTDYCTNNEEYMFRQNQVFGALETLKKSLDKNQQEKLSNFLNLQGLNISKNEALAIAFTLKFIKNIFVK